MLTKASSGFLGEWQICVMSEILALRLAFEGRKEREGEGICSTRIHRSITYHHGFGKKRCHRSSYHSNACFCSMCERKLPKRQFANVGNSLLPLIISNMKWNARYKRMCILIQANAPHAWHFFLQPPSPKHSTEDFLYTCMLSPSLSLSLSLPPPHARFAG